MESIKTEHTFAIAENQEEYNTVYGTVHDTDIAGTTVKSLVIKFKFSPEELAELNKNEGVFYYTQVTGLNMMRPMNISPWNPLPEDLR